MISESTKVQEILFVIILLALIMVRCISSPHSPQIFPLKSPFQSVITPVTQHLPQPAPGTGVILGMLKVENTNQPMVGIELYLAQHIGATQDTPIYKLDPDSAPHVITGGEGRFVFKDIPPGRYAIVIWTPFNSFLVRNPATGSELVIDVEPDRVYDVGILFERYP